MTTKEWDAMIDKDRVNYKKWESRLKDPVSDYHSGITTEEVEDLVKKIYDMGFAHGQSFVWYQRSGMGMYDDDKPAEWIQTTTSGDGDTVTKKFKYENGQITEVTNDND